MITKDIGVQLHVLTKYTRPRFISMPVAPSKNICTTTLNKMKDLALSLSRIVIDPTSTFFSSLES